MGEWVRLKAADEVELGAYVARPEGEPLAGLVVVQEIFGINDHIRRVTDTYARDGFLAVAPALFDRIEPNVELAYEGADLQRAMSFIPRLDTEKSLMDTAAAVEYAAAATGKRVGVIGYCFGGTIAWLAATRLPVQAAVGYYGGRIAQYAGEQPHAPVMLHFGREDKHIPEEEANKVKSAHPEVEIYWYLAGHGFNCDARSAFNPAEAAVARERSLAFLRQHLSPCGPGGA
jgi:carboxymethylenebutenolidase